MVRKKKEGWELLGDTKPGKGTLEEYERHSKGGTEVLWVLYVAYELGSVVFYCPKLPNKVVPIGGIIFIFSKPLTKF